MEGSCIEFETISLKIVLPKYSENDSDQMYDNYKLPETIVCCLISFYAKIVKILYDHYKLSKAIVHCLISFYAKTVKVFITIMSYEKQFFIV